jgi:hypothetical protein
MVIAKTDIQEIQAKISSILGKKAWGVSLGVGSFITLEFGNPIKSDEENQRTHGEWHLWVYCCEWRLEKGLEVLAGSEDERTKIENAIQELEGLVLQSIDILQPAWDTIFKFENDVILRLFSVHSEDYENWMLYTPDGNVLTVGPGASWSYESSR